MRTLLACLVLVSSVACATWRTVEVSPAAYLRDNDPDHIRITRSDSSRVSLRAPVLHGDTIVGLTGSGSPQGIAHQLAVPLSNVQSIAVPTLSPAKSVAAALLVIIPVAIVRCSGGAGMFC